jgi:hypothetical protein
MARLAYQVAAEVARNNSQRKRAKSKGGKVSPPASLADLLAQQARQGRSAAPTSKPKNA